MYINIILIEQSLMKQKATVLLLHLLRLLYFLCLFAFLFFSLYPRQLQIEL